MQRVVPVVLLFALVGCGNTAPVSGTVTMSGKPLPYATVIFNPSAPNNSGPGSIGTTDEEGKYTLQITTGSGPGAHIGTHKVVITAYEGGKEIPSSGSDMKFRKQLVADEYNVSSTLTFDVPSSGTKSADFDVKPKINKK